MTDKKKTEILNEAELDDVTGGHANLEVSHIKPGLTEKTGKRVGKRVPGDKGITVGPGGTGW